VLQLLISGLTVGSEYGLIALGIHIVLRATRVVNFAQGEFAVVGGLVAFSVVEALNAPVWIGLFAAVLAGFVLGLAFERFVLRPAGRGGETGATIATIGAVFVLLYGHALIPSWGAEPHAPRDFPGHSIVVHVPPALDWGNSLGASHEMFVPAQAIWVVVLLVVALAALYAFFERTYYGKAIRAAADNPLGARLIGIDVRSARAISVGLGIALAAYAGTIIGPITLVGGAGGFALTIKGFVAAILGGLESPVGCVAGGLVVGLLQSLATTQFGNDVAEPMVYAILLVMLLLRPQGLFGRREAVRD
jgi:branched-chain amino acid transport system permease protein